MPVLSYLLFESICAHSQKRYQKKDTVLKDFSDYPGKHTSVFVALKEVVLILNFPLSQLK